MLCSLPETALPGTVKVIFAGASNYELLLADTEESAGEHIFNFDPADPAASPHIADGEPLPDGLYTVFVVYQDETGNAAAASDGLTQVTIDTTPPTITPPVDGFAPLIVYANTGLADYVSQLSVSDATPLTVSQQPPIGTVLAVGTTHVTLTATDAAGNMATLEFNVVVRPEKPISVAVLSAGDPAPGAGTPGGPPADAHLLRFGVPAIDDDGNVAFLADWNSLTEGRGRGLFTHLCLAKVGDPVADIVDARYQSFLDPVIDNGRVACIATLVGAPNSPRRAVVSYDAVGAASVIARTGDVAPGTDGACFRSFTAIAVAGNYTAIYGRLAGSGGKPEPTFRDDVGIWTKKGANPLTLLLREGQIIEGKTIKTLLSFLTGNGSPGQGRGWLFRTEVDVRLLVKVVFFDGSQAVIQVDPDKTANPFVLSRTGLSNGSGSPDVADASFARYSVPAATRTGSGFLATLTLGAGGIDKTNAGGIFNRRAVGNRYTPSVRTGDPACATGATFTDLKDIVLAEDGYAFPATIVGGKIKGLAKRTVWWQRFGSPLRLLAQGSATPAEVGPGIQWRSFSSLAIATGRGPLLIAKLTPNQGGVTTKTATGLWATDFSGAFRLLIRSGVTQIGGKTVSSFTLLRALPGSVGVTRSFNRNAQVVWRANFTDKTGAIVVTEIP